jgi:phosphoribosylglycinamide formyltransferase-1
VSRRIIAKQAGQQGAQVTRHAYPAFSADRPMRVAVLASGEGGNFAVLADAAAGGGLGPASIELLLGNRAGAPVFAKARQRGTPAALVAHLNYPDRRDFDAAMVAVLNEYAIDFVVMAGFMRIVTPVFFGAFGGRALNVHPSLLPAFPGADALGDALAYGARVTGATVHLVEEAVDAGPIVAQEAVPIAPDDTRDSLAARIHAVEHRLLPAALRAFAEGRVSIAGRHVIVANDNHGRGAADPAPPSPPAHPHASAPASPS